MPAIGELKTDDGRKIKGNFIPLTEAAKQLKVSRERILRWIKNGKVKNVKLYKNILNHWMIEEKDIEKLRDYINLLQPIN